MKNFQFLCNSMSPFSTKKVSGSESYNFTLTAGEQFQVTADNGQMKRREWVSFSHRELVERLMGSPTQANQGLKIALVRKYIERREAGKTKGGIKYEYRIHWNSPSSSSHSATE